MQPTDKTNKRTAIYARVSTKDQQCDRQIADLTAFATKQGMNVTQVVKETASGAKNDRCERAKLIAQVRKHELDVILVTELSRWGRSTTDLLSTVETLHSYHVTLWPTNQDAINPATPTGKLILSIFAILSEFERALIVERINSGLAAARSRGKVLGRVQGSGTTIKKHSKQVAALHTAGMSQRQIASRLAIGTQTVRDCLRQVQSTSIDDLLD